MYLAATVRGVFFYLYLVLEVYSRKIIGLEVFEAESAEHATPVVRRAYLREGIAGEPLVLHSDNGAPERGHLACNSPEAWRGALLQPPFGEQRQPPLGSPVSDSELGPE